jgi:muramoyltetrapeptide carboxypeptidase
MPRTLLPPSLRRGATIGIVAPASPPKIAEHLEAGLAWLRGQGYRIRRGASLDQRDGYLSGNDETRAADINAMFADASVDAIICSRGGYGSGRILSHIDYAGIQKHPKVLVGYSDITALMMAIQRMTGLVTFAGPMVASDFAQGMDAYTEAALFAMITRIRAQRRLAIPAGEMHALGNGSAVGRLLGGNMAVLMTLLGTPYEPEWTGSILFLEDVGENVYKIDRMFSHLKNAGVLSRIRGLLLGSFTGIPDDVPNRELDDVVREYTLPVAIPVLSGIPFGHQARKLTLPMGAKIGMDAARKRVTVLEPVLRRR